MEFNNLRTAFVSLGRKVINRDKGTIVKSVTMWRLFNYGSAVSCFFNLNKTLLLYFEKCFCY